MQCAGGKAQAAEQGGKRIAAADGNLSEPRVDGRCAVRLIDGFGVLREGRGVQCGQFGGRAGEGVFLEKSARAQFQFLGQVGFLGFDFSGGKHQQSQTEQCSYAAGSQQVAFGIQRRA
ncbi:hypothetical protein D3C77_631670 [compost metagenome]